MSEGDHFARRLLTSVDAQGYGPSTDRRQGGIQRALLAVLDDAAARAGLRRDRWERQVAGDGELAVLPPDEPEPRVVDDYVMCLAGALRRANRDGRRLRLRLAVHHGTAVRGAQSHDGAGVVEVSRLCDSSVLRNALTASEADLVVLLSERVFQDVVRNEYTSLSPSDFREVRVTVKEYDRPAYLYLPGHDAHSLDLSAPAPRTAGPSPAPAGHPNIANVFHAPVDARGSVFGPYFGDTRSREA
ncbi:hypothetical protein [Actinocorallia aurantiaca]|uniref:Guanylate cyclase domain-containing protein n=1 Tax=Actinocorallia aurantiaca TaxID=46204 RepID=A0ABN3TVC4_9ACTN